MQMQSETAAPSGPAASMDRSFVRRIATVIAFIGGLLSFCLAVLVTTSVLLRWFLGQPVPGDFEFVQMGTALVVFCCLPLCQIDRGNIIVDTFTSRLSRATQARIDALWDVVYALVIGVIAWSMVQGVIDAWRSGESTMVSQVPLWPALAISTGLIIFLVIAALYTAQRLLRSRS
jgi:TRAP-type C4-dicarboxylate transport system permease small subunit